MAEPPINPEREDDAPACATCGGPMSLVRVLPKLGGLPELRTFRCGDCGDTESFDETLVASPSDES